MVSDHDIILKYLLSSKDSAKAQKSARSEFGDDKAFDTLVEEYSSLISSVDELKGYKTYDSSNAWSKIESQLDDDTEEMSTRLNDFYKWIIGLIILGLLSLLIGWFVNGQNKMEIFETETNPDTLFMADGSQFYLAPFSRLQYPKSYNKDDKRSMYLDGTATFDIEKDGRKFLLFAGPVNVDVLGTIFSVDQMDTLARIETLEGRIQVVDALDDSIYVILNDGQRVTFDKNGFGPIESDEVEEEPVPLPTVPQPEPQKAEPVDTIVQAPPPPEPPRGFHGKEIMNFLTENFPKKIKTTPVFRYSPENLIDIQLEGRELNDIINELKANGQILIIKENKKRGIYTIEGIDIGISN